jgi:large conductance mechanosensitive channel
MGESSVLGHPLATTGNSMLKEFKEFIARGNVLDMAVGIIIGAAFTTIVKSLVEDILMPPIGLATGGVDFANLFVALNGQAYESLKAAKDAGAATLNYGVFTNAVINFLIVAFVIFMVVRSANRFLKQKETAAAAPAPPPREVVLLEEIRDLLKRS